MCEFGALLRKGEENFYFFLIIDLVLDKILIRQRLSLSSSHFFSFLHSDFSQLNLCLESRNVQKLELFHYKILTVVIELSQLPYFKGWYRVLAPRQGEGVHFREWQGRESSGGCPAWSVAP